MPAESGPRRSYHWRRRNDRGRNAVNSRLAVVENWRDIAEAGRSVDWRRDVPIIPRVVVSRPGASNELRIRLKGRTNCARRSAPASARSRRKSNLRTRLCQLKDHGKGQSRADYDFRFHATAILPYINAHELASCNSDSCRLCGNLAFARRLRVGKIDLRLLQIAQGFSGQAAGCADSDSHDSSDTTIQGNRAPGL